MELLILGGVILLLVLLNGLFVAAEFAIIGAPRSAIDRRAAAGEPAARRVRHILRDPRRQDRYIATAQLGITFASLGLGMYGEHELAHWIEPWFAWLGDGGWIASHTVASVVAVLVLTYLHIVVGEMVPKTLALQHAERTVLRITGPMLAVKRALLPLVILLNGIGNVVLRIFGVRREAGDGHYHSAEELQLIIRESEAGGQLHPETGRLLRELFDFGDLTAREVAVPRVHVVALPIDAPAETIATIVARSPHARYAVYERDRDHILGFVHIRSLIPVLQSGGQLPREALRPAVFVPETAPLEDVLEAMQTARTQLAVVLDEHGGTMGIITPEDLSSEIVGPTEEAGGRTREWFREANGRLRVAGTVRLDELGELLGREMEHDDVDTVSGLILDVLGRSPRVNDVVEWQGLVLKVTAITGHGVAEAVVEPKNRKPAGSTAPETPSP